MTLRVHVRHIRVQNLRYCSRGSRLWFKLHNLDWADFVANGIPEEILINTGDAMALAAVDEARKEWAEKAENQR